MVQGTYIVKVNVGSTVVGQDKITDRVGALDGVLVAIEGVKEPGVFFGDKVTRFLVGPELLRRYKLVVCCT